MTPSDAAWETFKVQHERKPRTAGFVRAFYGPLDAMAAAALDLVAMRGVGTAQGVQLDGAGQIVGIGRDVAVPLEGIYFTLDDPALGFDQGVWFGPYDAPTSAAGLDDATYRLVLRAKIALNGWDGTRAAAQAALAPVFATIGAAVIVEDRQDMTGTVALQGPLVPALHRSLLAGGYLAFRPAGVEVAALVPTVADAPLFALDADSPTLAGFDAGGWAEPA